MSCEISSAPDVGIHPGPASLPITLSGGRAIVTGGAGTLGRALAGVLLARGMAVVLADTDARRLAAARHALGGPAALSTRLLDVRDPDGWERLSGTIEAEEGPVTLLCNNACLPSARLPLLEVAPDRWNAMLAVGLTGAFLGARSVGWRMAARGHGHILNIASTAALHGLAGHGDYAATKAGLVSLSETLRIELAPAGVGVSVACPGAIGRAVGDADAAGGAAAAGRMDPILGMTHVVEMMLSGHFYIMTHFDARARVASRGTALLDAFDRVVT